MKILKKLEQKEINIELIKDLGMKGIAPNRTRWAEFKCPKCKNIVEKQTAQVKIATKKGYKNQCMSCANKERATTHGETGTDLHNRWNKMIARCTNKNYIKYYSNISYCDEWKDFTIFKKWALENGYLPELELDRENNNKGYYPDNCRWTDRNTQVQNTRVIRKNNTTGYRGIRKLRKKWQARIAINKKTIYLGTYNTDIEAALAYDNYVITNNLEHAINHIGELPYNLKDL